MESRNSLSRLLSNLMLLNNNSIESFSKVNEAITSDSETVTVNIENGDGSVDSYTIPSFGYLKNSIERLNNNIEALTNVNGGGSSVRLSDGTYRRLMTMRLPSEAPSITKVNSVNTFNVKSNYFFENMLNPLLYVDIDLTDQISADTERVMVKRFLLDTDTTTKEELFNTYYKNNPSIDYNSFLQTLVNNGIRYVLDEEIVTLPPRARRYTGNFSVIKITNDIVTETVNGAEVTRTRKLVKLNKLTYTDTKSGYTNTVQLAVGDALEVVSDPVDTKYIVKQVDSSTNTVVLELVEGFRSVMVGADYFRIGSEKSGEAYVEVTVGFNERCVVFVKPVDENSNLAAALWSPGTGFYTNELTFSDSSGAVTSLQQFYQKAVVDFGAYLLGYAHDWYPTSSEGVKPNTPVLNPENFRVVQINKQVTDSDDVTRIKKLNDEKNNLAAQIEAKNTAIAQLKNKLQTTNYASEILKNADKLELQNKVSEYESLVSTYNSKVKNITSIASSSSIAAISPKYRVRGFWGMPVEKSTDATGIQAIIKFKIRYRYLSVNGTGNNVEQIGKDMTGSFSNYNIVESVLRGRHKNLDGDFVWDVINTNDSEAVNINQLDIPITKGEQVEIQVKSVSEAGYPANPLESDWSEPIVIAFPEELSQNSVVDDILDENTADESQLQIDQTLNTRGMLAHVADSFNTGTTAYTHTSQTIASGFLSEEQTPISLYEKLAEMQKTIDQLVDIIGNSTGVMVVTLSDDNGNVYELNQDSLTKVYAGSYVTEASRLTIQKGAIITKNYSINIQNTAQTGLRLLAKISGSRNVMVPESENYQQHGHYPNRTVLNSANQNVVTTKATFNGQDNEYNKYMRYDLVPINLYAPDYIDGVVVCNNHYQSAQCKNQFINMRYHNTGGDIQLYRDDSMETSSQFWINEAFLSSGTCSSTYTQPFIWNPQNGGFNANGEPNGSPNGVSDKFLVHISHPYLKSKTDFMMKLAELLGLDNNQSNEFYIDYANGTYDFNFCKYMFRIPLNEQYTITNVALGNNTLNVKTTAAVKDTINRQVAYEYIIESHTAANDNSTTVITSDTNPQADNFKIGLTHKIGYEPNDQYLIGSNTCTSYLYLNPQNHNQIQVDGDSRNSSIVVTGGSTVSIPLTFQYRMTDYYGEGDNGIGYILGDPTISTVSKSNLNNISMANRVGIDIWNGKDEPTSFDIEIYATYGETSGNINPSSLVQYTASTMASAVNKANSKTNSVIDNGSPVTLNVVNTNKKKR